MKNFWIFFLLPSYLLAHTLSLGPEAYYVERTRATGANQTGVLYGGQIGYNRIKKWTTYWGVDAYYASGILHGENTSTGRPLKSSLTDWQIEGRVGFTLPYITLFGGYGYLEERINFMPPSRTTFHYREAIEYIVCGFLSRLNITPLFSMGLNAKAKWMTQGKSHVSNDPNNDPISLLMNNEWQYRIELPFNYVVKKGFEASFIPFYEFRHYGGHESYPYDFIDTQYQIWGTQVNLAYWF